MSRKKDSSVKKKSIMGTFSPRGRMFAKEPAKSDKIPRNAPCPCGSGKKFKHCCQKELGLFGRIKRFFTRSKKPK